MSGWTEIYHRQWYTQITQISKRHSILEIAIRSKSSTVVNLSKLCIQYQYVWGKLWIYTTPGSVVSWVVRSVFPLGRPNRQPSHGIMLKGESLAGMAFVGSAPYVTFGSFLFVWMTFLLWCLLEVDLMVISIWLDVGDIRVYIFWCMVGYTEHFDDQGKLDIFLNLV